MDITIASISADHPDIANALRAEGRAAAESEHTEQLATATSDGGNQERARIQAVLDQSLPGHDVLVQELAFDGKTSGPEAAVAVLQAQRTKHATQTNNIVADANDIPALDVTADTTGDQSITVDASAPIEQQAQAKWDASPDLRAEFGKFSTYLAYRENESNAKVLGGKVK